MKDDPVIAEKIATQLNIAILVLRLAEEMTPQRKPFLEVGDGIGLALSAALTAESACERIEEDE